MTGNKNDSKQDMFYTLKNHLRHYKAHKKWNRDLNLLLCVEVHILLQSPTEEAGTFIGTSTEI